MEKGLKTDVEAKKALRVHLSYHFDSIARDIVTGTVSEKSRQLLYQLLASSSSTNSFIFPFPTGHSHDVDKPVCAHGKWGCGAKLP